MKLIGITGKKRSGKDTAANMLVRYRGYTQFRFADILKAMTAECLFKLGLDTVTIRAMIEGDQKETPCPQLLGKSARHVMQTLGTEWGRKCIGEDFWVSATIRNANTVFKAVISDVRYPNEAAAIRQAGGVVVRILRDGCNGDGHSSEAMDFTADYDLYNNGTIEELAEHMKDIDESRN